MTVLCQFNVGSITLKAKVNYHHNYSYIGMYNSLDEEHYSYPLIVRSPLWLILGFIVCGKAGMCQAIERAQFQLAHLLRVCSRAPLHALHHDAVGGREESARQREKGDKREQ